MSVVHSADYEADLLAEFEELVETGELIGQGQVFMQQMTVMVDRFMATGELAVAEDPFGGADMKRMLDAEAYYLMFWRMFDRTPAAAMQDFAIKVRRILAKRIMKRVGEGVIFHQDVFILSGQNIELGDGVFVNRGATLDDRGPIIVDDHTMIAAGATITTHGHVLDDFTQPMPFGGRTMAPVVIGNNTVIGYNSVIMSGVTVGDRVIVAANSVVTRDIDDRWVVGGVPAKKIKQLVPRAGG
jgi:acetyltransferase-like isoleucine patch superfamily enzyme